MFRSIPTLAVAAALVSASVPATAQTVDQIVAAYEAARGGREKWASIDSQKMTGTLYTTGIELELTVVNKRPNLVRQDVAFAIPGQGSVVITSAFDGKSAWTINPMMGISTPQALAGPEAEALTDQADFDGALFNYKARGHDVELVETLSEEGARVHHLRITRPDRPVVHYYIDAGTSLERRVTSEANPGSVVELSDYRSVDGIRMPHLIRVRQDGQVQAEIVVTSFSFNVPVDDATFNRN
jgi:hypothetical protein